MQQEDRKVQANLSEVLDQALARIRAGESVEACLAAYPEHAPALAPLLRTGALLHEEADTALPPDLEAWLPTGARDFAAIAQQMLPQPSSQERPATTSARPGKRAPRTLSPDLSEILDVALARVGAGESVEVCLGDYPEHAQALAPLLSTGGLLRAHAAVPLPPELEAWLPRGAREFNAIAERMAPRYAVRRKATPPRKLSLQRTMATMAVAVALMGVVADTASAASLPGDPLYQWKRTKEDISLTLTTDPRVRSQLHVDYAQRRLSEFNTLLTNGDVSDTTMIADTLNNMLVHTQSAINDAQQGRNLEEVKPALYQLLDQAEGVINQASAVAPQAEPILDQAREEVNALEQHLPAVVVSSAADGLEPTASSTDGSIGAPTAEQGGIQTPVGEPSSQPTSAAGAPTTTPTNGQPGAPSATSGSGILPTDAPTAVPSNTPTTDPATVVPPTQVPPTNAPEPPGSTAVPTAVPPTDVPPTETPLPTNTPPPTPTPIPTATDGPLPTLPPTPPPRPSRTPPPTRTSTPTDTPPPTNTPTDTPTDTPQPTDTPTDAPTNTPTDAPTFTPTEVPTATATVFGQPGTDEQTSTPTSSPSPSAMPEAGSETPTVEPAIPVP